MICLSDTRHSVFGNLYRNLGLVLGFKKRIDIFNYWLALVPAFPVFKGLSEVLIRQE